jgi:hypothetical protein
MPALGNHEIEFDNGPQGYNSYLTRYQLPGNGVHGYSGGAQTQWLQQTLEAARRDPFIDWIVVQMHQCIASSRSFPTRGFDSDVGWEASTGATVQTMRPHPVTTVDSGSFDTSQGTVHLVLGGGGTDDDTDDYGVDPKDGLPEAKVFTFRNAPIPSSTPGEYYRPPADALEDATWSAMRNACLPGRPGRQPA